MLIGFFHLKIRLPKIKILPENGRISPKAFKSVRRTPDVCNLWFVICNFPQRGLILVLLEEPLQHNKKTLKEALIYCFNPCFTGRTTSTSRTKWFYLFRKSFQSLFYWKNHFNIVKRLSLKKFTVVSILVLLEEPLQRM